MSLPLHKQSPSRWLEYITERGILRLENTPGGEYELGLAYVLARGEDRTDRTGTGTRSVFGLRMEFDLQQGFPLVTTKKVFWKGVVHELLWLLSGSTNVKDLHKNGIKIWDEWADGAGDLGPVYGKQWRAWEQFARVPAHAEGFEWIPDEFRVTTIDQIAEAIRQIKETPDSRRILVSAFNVADLPDMALQPCHTIFQFYVTPSGHLDCQLYQRSGDMFLGIPFNIASYALLTMMIAQVCGLKPGRFIHTIGDAHIYENHRDQVYEQLSRRPKQQPWVVLNGNVQNIDDFTFDNIELHGYAPHPAIKGEVSV